MPENEALRGDHAAVRKSDKRCRATSKSAVIPDDSFNLGKVDETIKYEIPEYEMTRGKQAARQRKSTTMNSMVQVKVLCHLMIK